MKKNLFSFLLLVIMSFGSFSSYALPVNEPFLIELQTPFPTEVVNGKTVFATYKITNNTIEPRFNNYVKYFPNKNVTQVLEGDVCDQNFTLQPKGRPNDSCLLRVAITGAVLDTQPLVVCFTKGGTCAQSNALSIALIPRTLLSVGRFNSDTRAGYARSTDDGLSWISKLLPAAETGTGLDGVSCVGNHCVAVGFSQNLIFGLSPFTAITSDVGNTWTQQTLSNLPSGFSAGFLRAVYCPDSNCTAVGAYQKDSSGHLQLGIANSNNGGRTWTQLPLAPAEPDLINGQLYGVTYSQGTWIAAGTYTSDTGHDIPVTAVSTDRETWTQTIVQFPTPEVVDGSLRGISCFNGVCIAVGTIEVETSKNAPSVLKLPVLQFPISKNPKVTSVSVDISAYKSQNLSARNKKFYPSSTSPKDVAPFPAAAVSLDNGTTWSDLGIIVADGGVPVRGELHAINCLSTFCVLTGYEVAAISIRQVSFTSSSTGIIKTVIQNPENLIANGVFCTPENLCATASTQAFLTPAAARSTDRGASWIADLIATEGAQNGFLTAISGNAAPVE